MKRFHVVLAVMAIMLTATLAFAAMGGDETKTQPLTKQGILQRYGFIDEDGDGINDLARDSDNDGIPNCLDADWVRPQDGTGYMNRFGGKHQNGSQQGDGLYQYGYRHGWQNQWAAGGNPNFCNQTDPGLNTNRNRRTHRRR
jgi:hypothetical protein